MRLAAERLCIVALTAQCALYLAFLPDLYPGWTVAGFALWMTFPYIMVLLALLLVTVFFVQSFQHSSGGQEPV